VCEPPLPGPLVAEDHRHKTHAVPVKDLDDSREVEQGPAESVDLVDHDAVHRPSLDRRQEPLQGRAIHIAAGVPAIVEMIGDHLPLSASSVEFIWV
jgi:hypothetical protein